MVTDILTEMKNIQKDMSEIVGTSMTTDVQKISEFSQDRLDGFLQRMEASAMNIEEMTAAFVMIQA